MKTKHYLRGFAAGIVIAVVVMSVFQGEQENLSDEEIRARAAELGMVMAESGTLASSQHSSGDEGTSNAYRDPAAPDDRETGEKSTESSGASEDETESSFSEPSEAEETSSEGQSETEEPSSEEPSETEESSAGETIETEESSSSEPIGSSEPAETQESADPGPDSGNTAEGGEISEPVIINIYPGNGSYTVAQTLKQAGLVENAEEFDKFLCDNGYDNDILVGQIQIPAGSSYEEIAGYITSRH